jgi:DNA repair exonuclease SbcCD ATPase subunit
MNSLISKFFTLFIIICISANYISFAQTSPALEKAKVEIKTLQERLKNKDEEVDFFQKKADSLKQKTKELEEFVEALEAENQTNSQAIDSLSELNQALKQTNLKLEKELKEKNETIRKLQKTLAPIVDNHARKNSYLRADSLLLSVTACYLLVPDKNPPQRLSVKLECWDSEGKQLFLNQEFKIKIDQIPAELDDWVGQQSASKESEEAEESYCFYYNGTQKISHRLMKGKYQYRLFVNNQFLEKDWFEVM